MFSTDIKLLPEQWDGKMVVKHPEMKSLNSALKIKVGNVERALIDFSNSGCLDGKTAREIVIMLQEELDPLKVEARREAQNRRRMQTNGVFAYFRRFIDLKYNEGTKRLYKDTYKKLQVFCNENQIDMSSLTFDDVNRSFLTSFEQFCLKTQKQNTASRHLRDLRAVFNSAIDDEITSKYPFRKYKILVAESRDKSFSATQLRHLFNHACYEGGEQEAVDIFKLMFCLIGINPVDLVYLEEIRNGRVEYVRKKTHKLYSVKLEPDAIAIIEKYRGEKLLLNFGERFTNYKTFFNRVGKTLRKVGMVRVGGKKSFGKAILPDVCLGSARTSWATIAQEELDIPRDVIAAALGHSTIDVTTTYLRTEWKKKVDNANRMVIDWVMYGKKKNSNQIVRN